MDEPPRPAEAAVIARAYDLVLWLIPRTQRFPREFRQGMGERTAGTAMDLMGALVEASYSRQERRWLLDLASRKVNLLRYQLRLCHDLRLLGSAQLGHAAGLLDEIGRMTGGWKKQAGG